ncbi:response regulator transcription factor [Fulvivirga sp.]|uniref:response regulator transcription factor n=1 Tax=Fulvivirga sp. TaxID=1931237 RepID=UPI0032EAA074
MNTSKISFIRKNKSNITGVSRRILIHSKDTDYVRALKLLIESSSHFFVKNVDIEFDLVDNIQMFDPGLLIYEFDEDVQYLTSVKRGISELRRQPNILVIIKEEQLNHTYKLLEIGIDGIVIKGVELEKFADILLKIENNNHYLTQKVLNYLVINMAKNGKADLTDREYETLVLLGQGLSYKSIADKLNIGLETVRSHVKNLYTKLNVNSKAAALEFSRKNKLI